MKTIDNGARKEDLAEPNGDWTVILLSLVWNVEATTDCLMMIIGSQGSDKYSIFEDLAPFLVKWSYFFF